MNKIIYYKTLEFTTSEIEFEKMKNESNRKKPQKQRHTLSVQVLKIILIIFSIIFLKLKLLS